MVRRSTLSWKTNLPHYTPEVQKEINSGNGDANSEVNVNLRLTALKPLRTSWLVDLYNHLGSDIVRCSLNGAKRLASPNYYINQLVFPLRIHLKRLKVLLRPPRNRGIARISQRGVPNRLDYQLLFKKGACAPPPNQLNLSVRVDMTLERGGNRA